MATSYRQFINEIYEEHVEEASFLYEQRLALMLDADLSWFSYFSEEQTLDAHLDGLIIGAERALSITQQIALEGDVGAIYTLLSLWCLRNNRNKFLSELDNFDLEDIEVQQAIQLALLHRMPVDWCDELLQKVFDGQPVLLMLFVPALIKHQQMPAKLGFKQLYDSIVANEQTDVSPCIQGIYYYSDLDTNELLTHFILNGSKKEKSAAVLVLLRLGRKSVVEQTLAKVKQKKAPLLSFATGAPDTFFSNLIETNTASNWNETNMKCLAISGLADHIPELIKLLKDESVANFAAKALFIITGTRLIDNVFQEESWDKADLFDEEIERFEQGKMPQRTDGRAFGEAVEQISVSLEAWLNWWKQNHTHYISGTRYRLGMPISPVALVRTLSSEFVDNEIRELTYQELTIRYNAKHFFSTEELIQAQQKSILALYQWATTVEHNFTPGQFYLSGNIQ